MIRRRQIHPDNVFVTNDGAQLPVVSRDAILTALVDGVTTLDLAGGTLSVVVQRFPTGVPGEMVTVGAVMEYKDRTDARPQVEPSAAAPALFASTAIDEDFDPSELTEEELLQHFPMPPGLEGYGEPEMVDQVEDAEMDADGPQEARTDPIGDGLDPQSLQVEDLSAIPAEML